MTNEELNKFYDGITAHNKEILDREKNYSAKTDDFLDLSLIIEGNTISLRSLIKYYPEDSKFNDCGSKSNSDPFYQKINENGLDPELSEFLKKYLSNDELKDRLSEDNYMTFVAVQDFIDAYLKREKIKEIENKIKRKEINLNKVKSAFEKFKSMNNPPDRYTGNNLYDSIVNHIEREEYEFDFDKFLTEE